MQRFDCLDPNLSVKGHYFLEASAGTGKTFAIEHIVAKLLMDGEATLDQILVVTFTRASTRDLRNRIRATIERLISSAHNPLLLEQALCEIDTAPIFTIHAFCQRMLTEFSFEANIHLGEMEEGHERIRTHLLDFLRTSLTPDKWSTNQIARLLKGGIAHLVKEVVPLIEREGLSQFHTYEENVKRLYIARAPFEGKPLVEEFFRIAKDYKGICSRSGEPHEEWVRQIEALASGASLDTLLGYSPFVLAALAPEKRKSKAGAPSPLIDEMREAFLPIIEEASDVVRRLAVEAREPVKAALAAEEVITPDDILHSMTKALDNSLFTKSVREKYRAVIIDEFQDTDPLQWNIFSHLFSEVETMFLVGDPKQSIYSFRGADLYTYLKASKSIPTHCLLDTNYRSEPALVTALNTLFSHDHVGKWLALPQSGGFLEYIPALHRKEAQDTDFGDGKSAVHFWISSREKPEDDFFPWIASEIEWLVLNKGFSYNDCAILVRDRFQGQRLRRFLAKRNIPIVSKATESLKGTPAFDLMRNLLVAVHNPFDQSAIMQILSSPLVGNLTKEDLSVEIGRFHTYHDLFYGGGLAEVLAHFTLIRHDSLEAYGDLSQLIELLLDYEGKYRSLPMELVAFLDGMGEEEAYLRRPIGDDDAVTVMTIHMSKGLEFEIVFSTWPCESNTS